MFVHKNMLHVSIFNQWFDFIRIHDTHNFNNTVSFSQIFPYFFIDCTYHRCYVTNYKLIFTARAGLQRTKNISSPKVITKNTKQSPLSHKTGHERKILVLYSWKCCHWLTGPEQPDNVWGWRLSTTLIK